MLRKILLCLAGTSVLLAAPTSAQNLVVNGDFASGLTGWTSTATSPTTITWSATEGVAGGGSAWFARNDTAAAANGNYLYQAIPVTVGSYYAVDAFWKGDLLNGGTGRNWAEVLVGFSSDPLATPTNIVYKKATDGGPNDVPMPWPYESVLSSPSGGPANGAFPADAGYMILGFNIGGRAGVGPGYFYLDDVSVTLAPPPPSTTFTWTGNVDSLWSTAGNWDAPPTATGGDLVFGGSNNTYNVNDSVTDVTGITFAANAGGFILTGNALAIPGSSAITNDSANLQFIELPLKTDSGSVALNATAADITLTGKLGTTTNTNATRKFVVSGPGTVTLAGNESNQFGLGADINAGGTLVLSNALGNALSSAITIADGGTLRLAGASTDQIHFNTAVTMGGSAAVFDLNGQSEEVAKIQGAGGTVTNGGFAEATVTIGGGANSSDASMILFQDGNAPLGLKTRDAASAGVPNNYTLGTANTFTGAMTIGGITNVAKLANGGEPSSIGAGASTNDKLVIGSAGSPSIAVLRYTGPSASTDRSFKTRAGASIEVAEADTNLELTGNSFAGFNKTGAGTITLNSFVQAFTSGQTLTVSGGTVKIGSNSTGDMFHDSCTLSVGAGGTFDMAGIGEKFGNIAGAGSITNSDAALESTLAVSGFSKSSVFDGVISGKIALTHTDANSSTTLNGLNTYSGNTTVGNAAATFTLGATGGLTFYPTENGVTNMIKGAAGATVNLEGQFAFDLSAASTTDGNSWTIVDVGTLATTYAPTFTVNGFTGSAGVWTRVTGGNTWTFTESSGSLSLASSPTTDIIIDVASGSQTQAEAGYPTIATATSVTKTGAGTVVFDAANAYSGPTTVSAGVLQVANSDALVATNVTVDSGATLAIAPGTTMKGPSVIVDGGTLSAAAVAINNTTGIASLAVNAGTLSGAPAVAIGAGGQMSLVQDARVAVSVGGLSVDQASGGGRLDLGAGQVTIAAGGISAADLRADIIAGRNGGAWNGATGITSSTAASAGGTRAVGYVVNGDTSARVSYAASGDVDLSGAVNVFDLVSINSSGKYGTGGSSVWSQGDFNYDGATNVFDLVSVNTAGVYGQGNYFPAAPSAAGLGSVSAVPEPTAWLLTACGLGCLAAIRRRGS